MTSIRKIKANRLNGLKSRGPKTTRGKQRASANALQHGLSVIDRHQPKFSEDIQRIALAICEGKDHGLEYEQALRIAECSVILRCIENERVLQIERLRDATVPTASNRRARFAAAKARFFAGDVAYDELQRLKPAPGAPPPSRRTAGLRWKPTPERTELQAAIAVLPRWERLVRYERRARSRQKRAVLEIIRIKAARAENG